MEDLAFRSALEPPTVARALTGLLAISSDALAIVADERVRLASPAMAALLGREDASELAGASVRELVIAGGAPALDRVLDGAEGSQETLTGVRRDGTTFPLELRVVALLPSHARLVLARDLARRPNDALYRALFEVNSAVKLLIDPETGRIVDANAAAEALYGWSLAELRTMRVDDINTLPADVLRVKLDDARTRERTFFRFFHRTASGDVRHVEIHSGPVELDGRQLLLSIVHDVTERDAFEEQLRRAQRLETVGRLAGGVAHDFNNLLTVMMGSCGLVARHLPPESPAHQHLGELTHTMKRAAELTRQLLALSSRQVMHKRTLDPRDVIRTMQRLLTQTLGSRVALDVELRETPPVFADPGQLEQVVLNLALNARDAMPSGGTLSLHISRCVVDAEGRPGLAPGTYARLTVGDTGLGMDETTRARIFDPFFTTRADAGGTGLGLATVYGIVTQSDGHIEVRSELGRGTTFDVYLPASSEPIDDEPDDAPLAPATETRAARVALIDDRDDVRRVLAAALESSGFSVVCFASGDEALAASDDVLDTLSACVTDVVMPGTSGIEVAEALRRRRPELRIVLVSGDLRDHVRAAIPADARFLQKPFPPDELVRTLRAALVG